MSDLETETTQETTTFDHFGRAWTVPVKKHHRHLRALKQIVRAEGSLDADDIAEVYLSPEEYAALVELDVDADALTDFANAMGKAIGAGDAGNSGPSSTSS